MQHKLHIYEILHTNTSSLFFPSLKEKKLFELCSSGPQ